MKLGPGMHVVLVAEEFSRRPDEGSLRTLDQFARYLDERCAARILHCRGEAPEGIAARRLRFTRAGITPSLWRELRSSAADLVIYVPSASLTVNALWRARLIRMASRAPVVAVGLQRRRLGPAPRALARALDPGVVAVTSRASAGDLRDAGLRVLTLPVGVDLERFRPLDRSRRAAVRASLGWRDEEQVVLHVGHLRARRGLVSLAGLGRPGRRLVVLASVSERGEESLAAELGSRGIEVHREFVPDVERYYQAADAYVFPVRTESSAIDFPLSVLEALACGLPVLSTRHGALVDHFDGTGGLRFLEEGEDPGTALAELLGRGADPRDLVAHMGWERTFDGWMDRFEEVLR